jgi:hypothetical protein
MSITFLVSGLIFIVIVKFPSLTRCFSLLERVLLMIDVHFVSFYLFLADTSTVKLCL